MAVVRGRLLRAGLGVGRTPDHEPLPQAVPGLEHQSCKRVEERPQRGERIGGHGLLAADNGLI